MPRRLVLSFRQRLDDVTSGACRSKFMFDNIIFMRPNYAPRGVMGRVNVFLSDQLLEEINQQAKEEGSNRSALIQAAVEKYIEAKRRGRETEQKRKKMQEASRKMDALAKKLGKWDLQATIRKFRDTNFKGDS
jgi:Arc/MetJ-type ribon-helix-helix transcriptional regulator